MYEILLKISNTLSYPFLNMLNSVMDYPLVFAAVLGLIGALAPCQLTANISAITIYGNRTMQTKTEWVEIFAFLFGKVFVFSLLGFLVWWFGSEFQEVTTLFFPYMRKIVGPLIILIGLFLAGAFKLKFLERILGRIPIKMGRGKMGSFIMGASFSIAFCPTMFVLFFVSLMPVVLASPSGIILPSIFGIATSIPLLIILLAMTFLELNGSVLKKSRKAGAYVQKSAGILLIVIGIFDTIIYWG
ncbi:cytochrome c biogenesis protein CcdA [Bacillus ectoiniformans]|uniref:urease accessory protein UreH domain-containing protein n=1 Tax=Bacillus ectoiniformans TaxID=1494429 RepID=UPI00195A76BD|nr:sulfite exporter TauE/SafE family protein [Bacillus ectoiniformans]MBM7650484.1 cytochrome c biogenesis protein CcdA [Bacillus ectoiniformans]